MTPPVDDLRGFLDLLREQGQLLDIKQHVMPEPDLGAAATSPPGWRSTCTARGPTTR
jgi:hypothetical protein